MAPLPGIEPESNGAIATAAARDESHTTLRASESHSWYLDNGCLHHMTGSSHHMTRNKSLFTSFTEFDRGNVTFGDGNVARVKGKGTICAPNIPNLEEVLYVEGLNHLGAP
ncbi:hypothetical protein CK203_002542 [Vitis vinifera]|uniref:Retrovirus-related Pol polyprotein from transposon TNT 1-94-like beta-barrel domain-containing protein n=1 Tax=Vitis vinifera TaxID=29760 RepID=A0A438KH45_VITVI|nr:hypothetical protein CK203_002542 [Vitis vinifera]